MSCPPLTNKGGKLSISRFPVPCELTLPELAQLDYVVVPGVGSIGDTGIEQEISSYSTTNAGVSPQSKGAAVGKAWDVEMLESQSEARDILEAASAVGNHDTYATRIEWRGGDVEYSIVQVSSPTYVKGAPSGVRIVRYTMVPSIVPIVKNALHAPALYAPMYDAPDTVELNWFDLSSIEDGVHVYASYSKIDVNALPPPTATLAPNTVQYDYTFDMGEVLEERLYFRVAAFNSDAVKVSNEVSIGNPANVLYPDSPTWLFGDGESGYANTLGIDTLFTDTSGTTPVEEYGDTIALATNLADDGPDMVQATGPARPTYGRMPITGVRNLCARAGVPSEDFSDARWDKTNGVISSEGDVINGIPAQRFTLSGGLSTHRIRRAGMFLAGEVGGLSAWLVDVSGLTTKFVAIQITSPNRTGLFTWTGPQTITTSGSADSVGYTIVGDFQAIIWARFADARTDTTTVVLVPGAYGEYDGDGEYITVARVQNEFATEPTAYQKVTAAWDVTEAGIPSVDIAYLDSADDAFEWTLDAGTYHLFVAGEKGCYFDTIVHAGGEFTVGPTTWTGGPVDAIARLIGQRFILVPEYRKDEPFTQFEKEQMVAYAMARGCPGVWEAGSELVVNGDFSSATGWSDTSAGTGEAEISGGVARTRGASFANRGELSQSLPTLNGTYILSALCVDMPSGAPRYRVVRDSSNFASVTATGPGVRAAVVFSAAGWNSAVVAVRSQDDGTNWQESDNLSLKQLTLNTSP